MAKKYVTERINDFPSDPDAFIEFIQNKLDTTPVPRHEISIDVEDVSEYGVTYAYLTFTYTREETSEECREREARERSYRHREREQYERLKAKFEGK